MPRIRLSPTLFDAVETVRLIERAVGISLDLELDTPFDPLGHAYETIDPIKMQILDLHSKAIDAAFATGINYGIRQSAFFGVGDLTSTGAMYSAITRETGVEPRIDIDRLLAPLGHDATTLEPIREHVLLYHEYAIQTAFNAGTVYGMAPWSLLFESVDEVQS